MCVWQNCICWWYITRDIKKSYLRTKKKHKEFSTISNIEGIHWVLSAQNLKGEAFLTSILILFGERAFKKEIKAKWILSKGPDRISFLRRQATQDLTPVCAHIKKIRQLQNHKSSLRMKSTLSAPRSWIFQVLELWYVIFLLSYRGYSVCFVAWSSECKL